MVGLNRDPRALDFQRLHDATLESIAFDWPMGTVIVRLLACEEPPRPVLIVCVGATRLVCPAEKPWGPSVSVNRVEGPVAHEGGGFRLSIEMQSGDLIILEGKGFTLEQAGETSPQDGNRAGAFRPGGVP